MSATDEHTFLMDLMPLAAKSQVFIDGTDISGLLAGVSVSSHVQGTTTVHLFVAAGRRVQLKAIVPEAAIVIQGDFKEVARAFVQAALDVLELLNAHGLACPASMAIAAEEARNLVSGE